MKGLEFKVVRSRRRTLTLSVLPDTSILVKAPMQVSQADIERFVHSSEEWINKRLETYAKTRVVKRGYEEGEEFMYLGKMYKLHFGNFNVIGVRDDLLVVPLVLKFRIKKELENWYIKQARSIIESQTKKYAEEMKTTFASITLTDTKSRWGSCSFDNHLRFNWKLIMTPLLVLNYVIVHELSHTIEKNHSRSFWNRVRFANPSYKQQIKWLKAYGHTLVV